MSTKKYHKYSKDDLRRALDAVKHGVPFATAAKEHNVPRTTLIGKIKGIYPEDCRSGAPTVLTVDEENILEQWIINMGQLGFPVNKEQLLDSVALLVKQLHRPNKFANGRPGRHWFEGFLERHPLISQRLSQNLSASRASVTQDKIKNWFKEIQHYFSEFNIDIKDPKRIFNADESAFFLSPKGNKVLVKKGSKLVHERSGNDKECLTVLVAGNANGMIVPTMIMYPYERIPKHIIIKVPSGWGIGKSPSGWMTSESFYEYITNIFYPYLISKNIEFPVILYLDGHKSHVTMPLTDFCRKKQIILISFLPNSTHILQPLDVGLFKALKVSWRKQVQKFKTENGYKSLNRENFAVVLEKALNSVNNIESIFENAFKTTGIFPFNSCNIDFNKLLERNNKQIEPLQIPQSYEILKHLRFLESYIKHDILTKFYEHTDPEWNGSNEYKCLYKIWYQMYKDSGLVPNQEEIPVNNVVIECEDGIVLSDMILEDFENLFPVDSENQFENFNKNIRDNPEEICNTNNKTMINILDQVVLQGDMTEVSTINTDKRNSVLKRKEPESLQMTPTKNNTNNTTNFQSENKMKQYEERSYNSTVDKDSDVIEKNDNIKNFDAIKLPIECQIGNERKENLDNNETNVENNINLLNLLSKKSVYDVTPEKDKIVEESNVDNSSYILPGIKVPTPFKKTLFWPEPSSSKKIKVKRQIKVPSVGTSDAWREYYIKKEEQQKKLLHEKEERKRKREENKRESQKKLKKHKKGIQNQNNGVEEVEGPQLVERKDAEEATVGNVSYNIGDYVIITYESKLYPGHITNKIGNKIIINAMSKVEPRKWKWPKPKDEIEYDYNEIIEKIKPPREINKRGFFFVDELKKYDTETEYDS